MKPIYLILILFVLSSCDCIQEIDLFVIDKDSGLPINVVKVSDSKSQINLRNTQGQFNYYNISGGIGGCPDYILKFEKSGYVTQSIKYSSSSNSDTVFLEVDSNLKSFPFKNQLKKELNKWIQYKKNTLGEFDFSKFKKVSEQPYSEYSVKVTPSADYLNLYKNFLFTSKDSAKILDIYSQKIALEETVSGNLQALYAVDSEIFYFDLINGTRNRVLFGGYYYNFDDAIWISNNEFLVVGNIQEDSSNELSIWYANIDSKQLIRYSQIVDRKSEMEDDYLTEIKFKGVNLYLDDQ